MLTTTSPWAASRAPSYIGSLPEPPVSEPPWIHTNTGASFASAGAHTFKDRQSSLVGSGSPGAYRLPGRGAGWMQAGPKRVASRTPFHAAAATGGRQRSAPTGACA